jgi:hypothetical protein
MHVRGATGGRAPQPKGHQKHHRSRTPDRRSGTKSKQNSSPPPPPPRGPSKAKVTAASSGSGGQSPADKQLDFGSGGRFQGGGGQSGGGGGDDTFKLTGKDYRQKWDSTRLRAYAKDHPGTHKYTQGKAYYQGTGKTHKRYYKDGVPISKTQYGEDRHNIGHKLDMGFIDAALSNKTGPRLKDNARSKSWMDALYDNKNLRRKTDAGNHHGKGSKGHKTGGDMTAEKHFKKFTENREKFEWKKVHSAKLQQYRRGLAEAIDGKKNISDADKKAVSKAIAALEVLENAAGLAPPKAQRTSQTGGGYKKKGTAKTKDAKDKDHVDADTRKQAAAAKTREQRSPKASAASKRAHTSRKDKAAKANRWNDFQRAQKGQGLTRSQMSDRYRQQSVPATSGSGGGGGGGGGGSGGGVLGWNFQQSVPAMPSPGGSGGGSYEGVGGGGDCGGGHFVQGYTRANGTQVNGYFRGGN